MNEKELEVFIEEATPEGIGVLEATLKTSGNGFHFEVVLDGLNHPQGSVSLAECEDVSRALQETIDASVAPVENETPEDTRSRRGALPDGLTAENYSLEVGSAGAERKLRIPGDLERFKGKPLRLRFTQEERKFSELVTYKGPGAAEGESYSFVAYLPRRKRNRPGKKQRGESFFADREELVLTKDEVQAVNLYLDF